MMTLEETTVIEDIIKAHQEHPEVHLAQKHLANAVTRLVHDSELTVCAQNLSEMLFERKFNPTLLLKPESILSSSRLRSFTMSKQQEPLTVLACLASIFPEHSKGKNSLFVSAL